MPGSDGERRAASAAVLGVLVVVLLVGWGATLGPAPVLRGPGPEPYRIPTSATASPSASASGSPAAEPTRDRSSREAPWLLTALVWGIAVLLVAAPVVLLVALVGLLLTRERRSRPPAVDDSFEVLDAPARLARALRADAGAQERALSSGDPRGAIEACWERFERQAEAAGLGRQPWETSTEFTERVLQVSGADPDAARALGRLYREARFSGHPMGESHRAEARRALALIQAGLASGVRP